MIRKCALILAACGFIAGAAMPAVATLHLMQIEQVIGGVDGDVTAQAIQLRLRANGECFVSDGKLWVRDAAGQNPVLLIDFTTDVPGCNTGDRVLITSSNFTSLLDNTIQPDFMLTNLIPESYLAAGTMTFENNTGAFVFWRLSWGWKNYGGDTTGAFFNDADGEFGPPYEGPLPADSLQALQFQGPANAPSTNNQDDYALTEGASTWTNNAGNSGTLVEPRLCPWDLDGSGDVGVSDFLELLGVWGPCPPKGDCPADFDGSGDVGVKDLLFLLGTWGPCP